MRITSFLIFFLLFLVNGVAQDKFEPATNPDAWVDKLVAHQGAITSLKASYTELKKVEGLKDPQETNGLFYFKSKNKIRLEQEKPQDMVFMSDGSKDRLRINFKEEKGEGKLIVFKQIKKIIVGMFNGDLIQNTKYFEPEYYESDEQYMIKLIPEDRKIRMYITEIVLKFNRTTLVLNNMETLDKSGNLGVMKFHDVQENIEIENSIFSNF